MSIHAAKGFSVMSGWMGQGDA